MSDAAGGTTSSTMTHAQQSPTLLLGRSVTLALAGLVLLTGLSSYAVLHAQQPNLAHEESSFFAHHVDAGTVFWEIGAQPRPASS
jgi:hypothetical protein